MKGGTPYWLFPRSVALVSLQNCFHAQKDQLASPASVVSKMLPPCF